MIVLSLLVMINVYHTEFSRILGHFFSSHSGANRYFHKGWKSFFVLFWGGGIELDASTVNLRLSPIFLLLRKQSDLAKRLRG